MSREETKAWLDQLRSTDREEARHQEHRDRQRGKLATGGQSGIARRIDIDGALEFEAGETDLDGRRIDDELDE